MSSSTETEAFKGSESSKAYGSDQIQVTWWVFNVVLSTVHFNDEANTTKAMAYFGLISCHSDHDAVFLTHIGT